MLFAAAALTITHPTPARAATTCSVTSTADSGDGTLRQKIGDATCDVITFVVPGPITLNSGQLTISRNLTITGPGADKMTVQRMDGSPPFRIFKVNAGATAVISGITISKGLLNNAPIIREGDGAGIDNRGVLTITDSTLEYNTCLDEDGSTNGGAGTISNNNTLTVERVTFRGNVAIYGGNGVANFSTAAVTNSTFSNGCVTDAGPAVSGVMSFSGATTIYQQYVLRGRCLPPGWRRVRDGNVEKHHSQGRRLGLSELLHF